MAGGGRDGEGGYSRARELAPVTACSVARASPTTAVSASSAACSRSTCSSVRACDWCAIVSAWRCRAVQWLTHFINPTESRADRA